MASQEKLNAWHQVDHIKGIKSPDDEQALPLFVQTSVSMETCGQAALLATETDVKKALFEELQVSGSAIWHVL